jgi:WD40 repeat protein
LCTAAPDDGVIKFWNLSSGECEATIRGHKYNITAILQYSPTQICCSSFDTKIRIWNIDSGVCEKIISTDKLQISLQRLPNGTIASLGSMLIARDSFVLDINVWDISTTSSVMTIQVGNSAYFTRLLIQLSSGELCASTSSGIHMYNYQTGVKIKTIALPSGTDDLYAATILHNQRLCLSTSKASTQKSKSYHLLILNLESEEYEQDIELEGEHSHITQLNDGRLISSCQDILTEWR